MIFRDNRVIVFRVAGVGSYSALLMVNFLPIPLNHALLTLLNSWSRSASSETRNSTVLEWVVVGYCLTTAVFALAPVR